jgi:Spy/CpxP family protein refolding chaperone
MKYFIILLLVTALFSDSFENHNERHINKELSHLKLSKEQNTKVKKILKEFRFDLKEFREYKKDIEKEKEKLFMNEIFKADELDKLNNALDAKAHKIEKSFLEKIHFILTPKQREKFIYYFDDWEVE